MELVCKAWLCQATSEGHSGPRISLPTLRGGGENYGFYTEGGGPLEGCAQRRGGAWLRCSQAPSSGCFWEGRLWGLSLGARTAGWRQLRWSR